MKYIPQNKLASYREKNKPMCCPILGIKTNDWVVDHDHQTGFIRGVISRQANTFLGKIENCYLRLCKVDKEFLPVTLEATASYLENARTNMMHPKGAKQLANRFLRMKKAEQEQRLFELKAEKSVVQSCTNAKERTKIYSSIIKGAETKQ